jgi:ABC-type transport system involved in multi-copper enzyme maturation permease subunit
MSTPKIASRPAGARRREERGPGFGPVLRAEWTKFRTVRGWIIAIVLGALLMVAWGLLVANGNNVSCQAGTGAACLPHYPLGPGGEPVTDSFYFVHQQLDGNGSITVRVTSLTGRYSSGSVGSSSNPDAGTQPGLQPWSKAGVIVKASTKQGSAYAAMMVTGSHEVRMQYDYTHDTPGLAGAVSAASPRWLRLTRSGGTLTGYDSADGTHWTKVGTAHLTGLPAIAQAGLFAASPDYQIVVSQSLGGGTTGSGSSVATAAFDHVSLSGTQAGLGWHGGLVGTSSGGLPGAPSGFRHTGSGFTVTGTGDIAPITAVGLATVGQFLTGAFVALIAVVVVGAVFVTAEYRRGLIRTTLAASPRRGRVLAAKAIVAGGISFGAGLAAAAVVVAFTLRVAHAKGAYVLPAGPLTELRVIAGTAALLAVAAVLTVAVGTLLRRSAVAVTTGIVVIVLPYILGTGGLLPVGAEQWLLRFTPAAAFAIQQSAPAYPQVTASYTPTAGYFPLAPWAGFAVLCAYAAVALALAAVALRRRDA